eukprot:CAMPEP_0172542484 /NCGR_PEP_ID=MMETSP1067-20121228/13092_1 /TAXON_ID=265564 ORGANISM="Thalassiosira punctigera, Strain Tpunct2005C2" /NCGR_SAMPLE_ID=MMETSP1067 /ASSEMBLY_ACC=CAM_ASM_000444 /LENGTH=241 /DNA_ID=CAMNT_0013328741 /DNA_START=209 /DNA_END=930 /DNA_ORIENTATION=+
MEWIGTLRYPSWCTVDRRHRSLVQLRMSTRDETDAHGKLIIDGIKETSPSELQKRFEEAMQRRRERRAQKESFSPESDPTQEAFRTNEAKSMPLKQKESKTSETNEVADDETNIEGEMKMTKTIESNEKDIKADVRDGSAFVETTNLDNIEKDMPTTKQWQDKSKLANDNNSVRADARGPTPTTVRPTRNNGHIDERDQRRPFDNHFDEDQYSDDPNEDHYSDEMYGVDFDQGYSSRSAPT